MNIFLNNQPLLFEGASLQELLEQQGLLKEGSQGLAVAVNNTVIRATDWKGYTLKEGDTILLIQPTQGG